MSVACVQEVLYNYRVGEWTPPFQFVLIFCTYIQISILRRSQTAWLNNNNTMKLRFFACLKCTTLHLIVWGSYHDKRIFCLGLQLCLCHMAYSHHSGSALDREMRLTIGVCFIEMAQFWCLCPLTNWRWWPPYKFVQLFVQPATKLLPTYLLFDTLHIGWSGVVGDWFMIDENECACIKGRKFPQYLVKCLLIWLQAPETLYRALATKLIIGMPYKVFPFVLYDFTIFLWLVISSSMSIWLLVVCCL